VGGQAYTWDNNGNLLYDGVFTYTYDAANRLIEVTTGLTTTTIVYNGLGDRVNQVAAGVTTTYTLDLVAGLTQVLADGTNTYLYGQGRIAQDDGTEFAYFLPDALGSVRQLADDSGDVNLARSYEPYGDLLTSAGTSTTTYDFTGEWRADASSLLHLRARYYSSYIPQYSDGGDFPFQSAYDVPYLRNFVFR
jgi:YD repeat-containing protein